ncbi:restriction endonuclease subunit S [Paenibacillus sp. NPDC056722]|uniref:restriction endonuclease subunit S n=1 Tax=Paenibacillus sp. NPDC056722 TaxID=3345924 RepID=UPI0036C45771
MNAPKLRFEGFNGDWKITLLSDLMSFNNGINADKGSYGHGRKFINVLDILNNNSIKYDEIIGSVSVSQKVEDTNKVEYGDLLFLRSSETREDVGKSTVYLDKNKFALFGGFVIRGKKQGEYQPYFLKLNLESPRIRHQIGSKAGGSTRFNVSQSILSSIEVSMPSKTEQQKIAEFMDYFDRKIKLHQEKIDLLKKQKKGYIQKIFNQELRFKNEDRSDFPNWELKKINSLFEKSSDKNTTLCFDKHKIISVASMRFKEDLKESSDDYMKTYNILRENEIAFEGNKSKKFKYGRFVLNNIGDGIVSHVFIVFKPKQVFNQNFLKEYINNEVVMQKILLHSTTSTLMMTSLNSKEFLKKSLPLPSIEEQNKIGEFLSTFEKRVLWEEKKLNSLILQKHALMHQMLI